MSTAIAVASVASPQRLRIRRRADVCTIPGGLDEVFDADGKRRVGTDTASNIVPLHDRHPHGLHPKQVQAATLLVGGMLGKDVAQALDIAEETVCRWRKKPEFQDFMQSMLAERVHAARIGLLSLTQDCIEQLRCLIHGGNELVSLRAIELVLGIVHRAEQGRTA
jgi:hypothetical protein